MREREVKMIVPGSFELPDLHDAVPGASAGDVEEREIGDVYYERRRDHRRLLRHLGDDRATELLDHLVAASPAPARVKRAARPARDVMPKLVRKRWKRPDRSIKGLGVVQPLRSCTKSASSPSDFATPSKRSPPPSESRRASSPTTRQGSRTHCASSTTAAVVGAWLAATADGLDGPVAFTAGQMTQQLVVDAHTHQRQWRSAP